jgi:hypothetical protein
VVRDPARLQPAAPGGHPGAADAAVDQVLPAAQGHPQEHRGSQPEAGPPRNGESRHCTVISSQPIRRSGSEIILRPSRP